MAGSPTSWYKETKNGVEVQWTRQLDKHDIIANVDVSRSQLNTKSLRNGVLKTSDVRR